jgi:TonB family protein
MKLRLVVLLAVLNAITLVAQGTVPPRAAAEKAYFEFEAEKQATLAPGSAQPVYPPELRAAHTEGQVLAQFVVDTRGRFTPGSLRILRSSHAAFSESVVKALPEMRFIPAEIDGHKVSQIVQQPFVFSLGP